MLWARSTDTMCKCVVSIYSTDHSYITLRLKLGLLLFETVRLKPGIDIKSVSQEPSLQSSWKSFQKIFGFFLKKVEAYIRSQLSRIIFHQCLQLLGTVFHYFLVKIRKKHFLENKRSKKIWWIL